MSEPEKKRSRRRRRRPPIKKAAPAAAAQKEGQAPLSGNIVLCGFMGCGKTSVGKRAAKLLGRQFCDLDSYIERKAGMTVSEIFAQEGEAGFRARETQAAEEVASMQGHCKRGRHGPLAAERGSLPQARSENPLPGCSCGRPTGTAEKRQTPALAPGSGPAPGYRGAP